MKHTTGGLCAVSFGLALGIMWGLAMLIMGITAMYFDYGSGFVQAIGALYIGYKATWLGSFIGLIWGFFDAAIGGMLVAWLYNFFCKKCCKCMPEKK